MSGDVASFGLIAELENPLTEEERDRVSNRLADRGFRLNYEGTLIRCILGEEVESPYVTAVFSTEHVGFPLRIVENSIKPFVDVWYNGSDDPMDEMTLEEFRAK